MVEKVYKVISQNGIHARVASDLVKLASGFDCDIQLVLKDTAVDFKSIMGVMSLGVYKDEIIKIICNGSDEVDALHQLDFAIYDMRLAKEY